MLAAARRAFADEASLDTETNSSPVTVRFQASSSLVNEPLLLRLHRKNAMALLPRGDLVAGVAPLQPVHAHRERIVQLGSPVA